MASPPPTESVENPEVGGGDWTAEESSGTAPVFQSGDSTSTNESAYPGEHFPETRQRKFSAAELKDWEFKKVRYAINEIFARKGAEFKTDSIRQQFETMSWYQPASGRSPQSMTSLLSEIEKHNLKLLGDRRATLVKLGQDK